MIVKSVLLDCSRERAFALFTEQAGEWWPVDRRHTRDASSVIRIEASGRFFERARDGTEAALGHVRSFEAPRRLVLDWFPGTGPDAPTRVEVDFESIGDRTRVTITHDVGDAGAERFDRNAATYARSWDLVLAAWRGHA